MVEKVVDMGVGGVMNNVIHCFWIHGCSWLNHSSKCNALLLVKLIISVLDSDRDRGTIHISPDTTSHILVLHLH